MIPVTYPSRHPATNATSAMITVTLGTLDEASSPGGAGASVEGRGEGEDPGRGRVRRGCRDRFGGGWDGRRCGGGSGGSNTPRSASAASAPVWYRSSGWRARSLSSTRTRRGERSGRKSVIGTGPPSNPPAELLEDRLPGERELAGQEVVHGAAEAEEIAPAVGLASGGLFRRHVVRGPDGRAIRGREGSLAVRLHEGAEAEVQDLDPAVLVQEQVRGLHVAVDDPPRVGVVQPQGGLRRVIEHFVGGERAAFEEEEVEAPPGHVFHDEIEEPPELVRVEGADHVRVIEPADQLHLPVEPGDRAGLRRDLRGDDLQGDEPAHQPVLGLVDPTLRARADRLEDDVAADHQAVRLVAQEVVGLEPGQELLRDDAIGQGLRLARERTAEDLGADLLELTIGQDLRLLEERQQVRRDDIGRFGSPGSLHDHAALQRTSIVPAQAGRSPDVSQPKRSGPELQ